MAKTIGILTSGGDAPGMNAAIRAITRTAINKGFKVYGVYDGYKGLVEGNFVEFNKGSVSDIMFRGGTILGTARLPEFKLEEYQDKAIEQMKKVGMDCLVAIGGDGTYRGLGALDSKGINVIGLPGTIDNDCPGTDYTIGFYTALNTIIECVDKLRDTSASHHRCSVIQVMGNHCGDLALYAGICCGAEVVVTKERFYSMDDICEMLRWYDERKKKRHSIVIVAEKLMDVNELADKISKETPFAGRATILGHIQRGGSPVSEDRILATRLGAYAVDLLDKGVSRVCVGLKNDQVVATPIETALQTPKKVNDDLYDIYMQLA